MIYQEIVNFVFNSTSLTLNFDSNNSYKFMRLVGTGVTSSQPAFCHVRLDGISSGVIYNKNYLETSGSVFDSGYNPDTNQWNLTGYGRFMPTGGQLDMIIGIPSDLTSWKTAFAQAGSGDDGIHVSSLEFRRTDDIDSLTFTFEYSVNGQFTLYGIGAA